MKNGTLFLPRIPEMGSIPPYIIKDGALFAATNSKKISTPTGYSPAPIKSEGQSTGPLFIILILPKLEPV